MHINRQKFLRFICILYLLGVRGLSDGNLDEMFSRDPATLVRGVAMQTNNQKRTKKIFETGSSILCARCVS